MYEQDKGLHEQLINIFSTGISVDRVTENMNQLLCCLPQIYAPGLSYENLFRIIIMRFIDAYDFDVRSIKKSCVHIVSKDGRIIPFETMNLFYRDDKEAYLNTLKKQRCCKFILNKDIRNILLVNLGILLVLPLFFWRRQFQ